MHLLILSDKFNREVLDVWIGHKARTDGVVLRRASLGSLSGYRRVSLLDYHVTIVHFSQFLPDAATFHALSSDTQLALAEGRTIICIAGAELDYRDKRIEEWLEPLNVWPLAAIGSNIQLTQHGKAQVFQDYFKNVSQYYSYWAAKPTSEKTIAVIGDTGFVIAGEYSIKEGKIVVLPPPSYDEAVIHQVMPSLYNLARKYYEDMQKRIFVGDEPTWVEKHKTQEHLQVIEDIEDLERSKQEFDMITYLLYGTGDALVDSVKLTLEKLNLEAEKTPPGATIDLTARNADETIKLAIEVTGTTDKIKKESKKVSQAWTYSLEKEDEEEKLVLMANTYVHLPIEDRSDKLHFTSDVENKFTSISGLLMTTADLYFLWKDVHEKKRTPDEVLKLLYESTRVLEIPSPNMTAEEAQ